MLDSATDVREGQELDTEALADWLARHAPELAGSIEVRQFPAGHSNLTYLLNIEGRDWVLRRPPMGEHVESGHDMSREWRVLRALEDVYPRAPKPIAHCEDTSVLGAPFYIMERVEGVVLRGREPEVPGLTPPVVRELSDAFVEELVAIHDVDLEAAGLESFGRSEGYVERQIEGWQRRYRQAQTDDIREMHQIGDWLDETRPETSGAALIHNDFKYDNLVLDPDDYARVEAVLDWEMATVGDPLMDLGTSLAYWIEPDDPDVLQHLDFGPTTLPGNYTRRELVDRYAELSGRDCSDILFYYVYGLYKVAVVGQQLYHRFQQGEADDPRFAALIQAVRALAVTAREAIGRGDIGA
jgi:aminoglycoside phosphotransferase (APT) family kinase protein